MDDFARLKIHTKAPDGSGLPPANRVEYALHYPGENVRWQLDANGWAIGYEVWAAHTQDKTP